MACDIGNSPFSNLDALVAQLGGTGGVYQAKAEAEPPAPSHDTREHLHGDDNAPTYRGAYDLPIDQIEVPKEARREMRKLNFNACTERRPSGPAFWLATPDYQNLAKWFRETFKPRFEAMLAIFPQGLFIKDMSVSPKDVLVDLFSSQARSDAEEQIKSLYPHMNAVDSETLGLFQCRNFAQLCAVTSAEKAIEYVLKSRRTAATLNATEAYDMPFSLLIRPFDVRIDPESEKRMAVRQSADTPAKVMALTSYTTPYARLTRPLLPADDYYPQIALQMAQAYIDVNKKALIPNDQTTQTIVDLCLCIDTNIFAAACGLTALHAARPIQFIERNPYELMPKEERLGPKENKYILSVFEHYLAPEVAKSHSRALEDIASWRQNLEGSNAFETMSKTANAWKSAGPILDILKAYLPETSCTDMNRFNWYTDREQLFDISKAPVVRVDVYDYYAVYTLGAFERGQAPVTYDQFKKLYFDPQHSHKTAQEELKFFMSVYQLEFENGQLALAAKMQALAASSGAASALAGSNMPAFDAL